MDFLNIAKAWIKSYNPSEKDKKLAEKRHNICGKCPYMVESVVFKYKCKECGCPIGKKIFSETYNDCPLKKWESVDSEFFPPTKKTKTLL